MITSHHTARVAILTPLLALFPVLSMGQANSAPADSSPTNIYYCPLERIGTQLVRCDNLTGAGVDAPYWIPEQK